MNIVIATTNPHKIREIRALLSPLKKFDFYSLVDFPNYTPPEETGSTFEENAVIKATSAAKALKMWAIADDSGLIVPALNGAPGVHSARYAGENATEKDNRKKLLKEMERLEDLERSAYTECCIALSSPEELKKCFSGICEGMITAEERGRYGFGYDSIFLKHEYSHTFGEIDETVKNQVSHRAKALEKLKLVLEVL